VPGIDPEAAPARIYLLTAARAGNAEVGCFLTRCPPFGRENSLAVPAEPFTGTVGAGNTCGRTVFAPRMGVARKYRPAGRAPASRGTAAHVPIVRVPARHVQGSARRERAYPITFISG
jgi:hypothetical protein